MSECFFIFQSGDVDTRNVIEAGDSGNLSVSSWNRGNRQLWRWATGGSLMNKFSENVIDLNRGDTKTGTKVFHFPAHEGKNQKWRIADGRITSFIGEDLNITASSDGSLSISPTDEKRDQKWRFVPEAMSDAYEFYLLNDNPAMKAFFLKTVLLDHLHCVLGCTIEEYESKLKECADIGEVCVNTLNDVAKGTGIAKVSGGGVAIAGGTAALAGLFLAPFTAGLSLVFTVGGAIAAGAGGLTSLGAVITEHVYTKEETKIIKPLMEDSIRYSIHLHSLILEVCKEVENASEFARTSKGKEFLAGLVNFFRSGKVVKAGVDTVKGMQAFKGIKEMRAIAAFIQADAYAVEAAMIGAAEFAAAGGLRVPMTGRVILQAGSVGAKLFSGALSVLGIAFGIWDVMEGAKQISEGSDVAIELRKSVDEIKKQGEQLIKTYHELEE